MKLNRARIIELRKLNGLSQPQLAERIGIKVGTLRSFEQERHDGFKAETVYVLAMVLGVPMESLFAEEAAAAATGGQA